MQPQSTKVRLAALILLGLIVTTLTVRADEKVARLKAGEDTYTNVTVTMVTTTDIFFTSAGGSGSAKLKRLEPGMQKHFGFDPDKARHAELAQAQGDAEYRAQAARPGPTRPAKGASGEAGPAARATNLVWSTNLPRALARAKAANKGVLLLFDGSDWCPTSAQVYHDTLDKPEFMAYAQDKLELVLADFPHHIQQSDQLKEANADLSARFNIRYYPTFILLNAEGENLGGVLGYVRGGPGAFIEKLEKYRTR